MTTRDLPDHTRMTVLKHTGGFIGIEELAYRLGCVVPADIGGNLILGEDFEREFGSAVLIELGGNSAVTRSTEKAWRGDWSAKLFVDDHAAGTAGVSYHAAYAGQSKYACRAMVSIPDDLKHLSFYFEFTSDAVAVELKVWYDRTNNRIAIFDKDGNQVIIDSSFALRAYDHDFYPMMLVADLATGYYSKFSLGPFEYDLSAYELPIGWDSDTINDILFTVEGISVGSVGFTTYVDDMAILKNMP